MSTTVATEVAGSSTKASSSTKEETLTNEPTTETSTEERKTGNAYFPLKYCPSEHTQKKSVDIDVI